MFKTLEDYQKPIVAIAYEDRNSDIHILYCEEPIAFSDIDFQEEHVRIGDFNLIHKNMNAIIVCTEDTLKELKEIIRLESEQKLENT